MKVVCKIHVFVAPQRRHKLRFQLYISDVCLYASKLLWLVPSENLVQDRADWNFLHLLEDGFFVGVLGEVDLSGWPVLKLEREFDLGFCNWVAILIMTGEMPKAD